MYLRFGKRVLDLVGAAIGAGVCLPLLGVLGIFIKASSPGPIFFRQERLGKNGRVFKLLKFRTMVQGPNGSSKQFTPGDESRVTRIGKVLRKTKLDELPQLVNVLAGDMSLVGPRPEVPQYQGFYGGEFGRILEIKPGMTDFASIKYHEEEKLLAQSLDPEWTYTHEVLPDKLHIHLKYTDRICFREDLKILLETVVKIFTAKNGKEKPLRNV